MSLIELFVTLTHVVMQKKEELSKKKKGKSKSKAKVGNTASQKLQGGLAPTVSVAPKTGLAPTVSQQLNALAAIGGVGNNQNPGKDQKLIAPPKEKPKKKAKLLGQIDIYGQQFQAATLIEGYSFFQDLNFGDMAMVFNNPYYDFQYKERQDLELYQFNHLKELRETTMARINLSAKQTKKMEADNIKNIQNIKDKFKKLVETDSRLNIRIDLQEAYDFYAKFINLKPENQIESRKDEKHQKQAFANALIYFSDRYYVNDMARVKVGKQPYSDCSSQSLRDFLLDGMFEFNIFHKIAKRKLYTLKENNKSVIGGSQDTNPLGYFIEHKEKKKPTLLESALSKNQKKEAFKQVLEEETNYFFIKRPDELPDEEVLKDHNLSNKADRRTPKQVAADQYRAYMDLTIKLNDVTLHYYKDYINKKEQGNSDLPTRDTIKDRAQSAIPQHLIQANYNISCKIG